VPRTNSQGLGAVEVSHDQKQLTVTFIKDVPLGSRLFEPGTYALTGGRRLHPRVLAVTSGASLNQLVLHLDQPGDFSIYTLTVSSSDIDPFFASKKFSFKIECEDPFDCRPPTPPLPAEPDSPPIDYLTKDYAGFRRLLVDQVTTRLPEWTERSEADLGIALIELLAEAADRLSYYQDRVANEAYLSTASQRRSVQLHAALVGYRLRPGVAAATHLYFEARRETLIAAGTQVRTHTEGDERPVIFETGPGDALLHPRHNQLTPYTWENARCCLPAGATEVTLLGDFSQFRAGDALLIADATDPDRREIVQLTADPLILPPDPIKGHPTQRLTVLRWDENQALTFDYCLDAGQTVVRGNLVPATHGESISDEKLGEGDEGVKRLRFTLSRAPLTHIAPSPGVSAAGAATTLVVEVGGEAWDERASLIESGPFDQHYRVELDDDGYATLVFGDGVRGQKPSTGRPIRASYRIGIGPAGDVGRDTLTALVTANDAIVSVTNPLAAQGGLAPEDKDLARRVAPLVIRTPLRCVTESDYERAASEYRENGVPRVQRARARFVWTGSWLTVFVHIDPIGGGALSESLRFALYAHLKDRKLAGYDLEIRAATYVPLALGLRVCVRSEFFAADVRAGLLRALSNRANPDGTRGFFHPDNFTFGDPVLLSRLYAAVEAVPGVDSVVVTAFCRLHQRNPQAATGENLGKGRLPVADMEIVRLDNDPSFPENGRLNLELLGGK
jgi:hypothetical protein